MSQTNTDERLKEGTVIDGRYVVKRLLGTGGFANVYLAEHQMLGTEMAVKVLHAPLASAADKQFAARFEREARVAAQMRHPNVVNVTDFGFLEGGDPYIVMEYLRGRDLDEELREHGPMDPDRLLRLMVPAVQAVGEAHKMGVVHKDLKPSNLFLVDADTPSERLVVLDFGVARVFDDSDENITQTGAFTGTPAYLPPEYIREQRVTAAFDVYQMGLILIECMTGRQAIEADGPMGFLLAHCMGRLTVSPEFFDNDLGVVLRRAIAIEDGDRYTDCAVLADALAGVEAPNPQTFTGKHYVREMGPMSSDDVAAFADTVSSGQLVGDAFITGTGQTETGPRRQPSGGMATVEQPVVAQKSTTPLVLLAGLLLLLVGAAGAGVFVLLGEGDAAVADGADAAAVEPSVVPDELPESLEEPAEIVLEETEKVIDEVEAATEPTEEESGESGASDSEEEAAEEAAAQEAEAKAKAKAEAEARARAERRRRAERARQERARRLEEEKKKEEAKTEEKSQERLLLVD